MINVKKINIVFPYLPSESHLVLSLCALSFSTHISPIFLVALLFAASLTFSLSAFVSFVLQVDRLMELHFKYLEAVQQADKRIEGEKHVSITFLPPTLSICPLRPPLCTLSFTLDADCWMDVFTENNKLVQHVCYWLNIIPLQSNQIRLNNDKPMIMIVITNNVNFAFCCDEHQVYYLVWQTVHVSKRARDHEGYLLGLCGPF